MFHFLTFFFNYCFVTVVCLFISCVCIEVGVIHIWKNTNKIFLYMTFLRARQRGSNTTNLVLKMFRSTKTTEIDKFLSKNSDFNANKLIISTQMTPNWCQNATSRRCTLNKTSVNLCNYLMIYVDARYLSINFNYCAKNAKNVNATCRTLTQR